MSDTGLELQISRWLDADAGAIRVPIGLRGRIIDIPAEAGPARHWWHRFAGLPAMSGAVVTAGAFGALAASLFFGLFDAPAGTDGEPCNNRQVQQALDNLRDAEGYRYVNRDQLRQLDPEAEVSFDNPQYIWTDAWTSEGAYLAPDRAHDAPTFTLPSLYNRGYTEHLQVDGHTYELREIDGAATWVETTNWPTANLVYGYVADYFPTSSIPGVTSLDWNGTAVPDDLPGVNGCTAAALLPVDDTLPAAFIEHRILALRIDIGSLRPTAVALEPQVGERGKDGQSRSTWELTWTNPSADEFVAPAEAIPDPNTVESSYIPEPSPSPLLVDPSAWTPVTLPADASAGVSDAVAGDRFVAVGATYVGDQPSGLIWTSTDGATWALVEGLARLEGSGFQSVAWDGSMYLALAYRNQESPEGPQFATVRPETWVSTDGLTWEPGGDIGPDEASGEVANPNRVIAAGPGWVASGSIWSLADNQQRPAFFTSRDGVRWQTIELEGTGSGAMGRTVVMPDGSLLATGCESPGATNSGAFGEGCYRRPWRSDDGITWTPGTILDVGIQDMARWGDGLVAIASDADPTQQDETPSILMTSTDGEEWEPMPGFPTDGAGPGEIRVVGDQLIVTGQVINSTYPFSVVWRSADGKSWESIGIGLPEDGVGTIVSGAVQTPSGLGLLGEAQTGENGMPVPLLWLEP